MMMMMMITSAVCHIETKRPRLKAKTLFRHRRQGI